MLCAGDVRDDVGVLMAVAHLFVFVIEIVTVTCVLQRCSGYFRLEESSPCDVN